MLPGVLEQIAELLGFHADHADQADVRIEIAHRHADAGTLSRYLAFRTADVGSATDQIGRHTHDHVRRSHRHAGTLAQDGREVGHRHAEQYAEPIRRLPLADLERRDQRFRLLEDLFGLVRIAFGRGAIVELISRQLK